jgi:cytochrome c peroxidase
MFLDFFRGRKLVEKLRSYFLTITLAIAMHWAYAENSQAPQLQKLAPGYGELKFSAPAPGTYHLPVLGLAGDGNVRDSDGSETTLHKLMGNEATSKNLVLLSFIYTTCSDINGCPLATAVFHRLKNRLKKMPDLADRVRLITLSFNPEHDTPERMKAFGAELQGNGVEWLFLTPRSEKDLQPILKNYQQTVEKVYDSKGNFTNTFNHNLRVYLIDQHKQVRNIYNAELLHPDTLVSDLLTLERPEQNYAETTISNDKSLYKAGDNKSAYEDKNYQTHSLALTLRKGQPGDLLKNLVTPPLGLPKVLVPDDNPISQEKINLGRKLFYDRRLSINNTFSCAMCHIPEQGFTSNEMATAVGVEGRTVRRNSSTLYNVAYMQSLFQDGRETSLENQVWAPLLAHNEMANPSIGYVVQKINNSADYGQMFEKAFGKPPGMETLGMAIASYERTLNSASSTFDRWYYGKEEQVLEDKAKRGFKLFSGKAGCSQCHSIAKEYALFTDNKLHNTGIGFDAAMHKPMESTQRVQVAPGVFADVPNEVISSVSEVKANDLGRYEVTQKPEDRWLYKTPTLRNIGLTAPYMHNGSIASLREIVEFYNRGGIANENLDPLVKPLHLITTEIEELTSFLESLTGDNVNVIVSDAFDAVDGESR